MPPINIAAAVSYRTRQNGGGHMGHMGTTTAQPRPAHADAESSASPPEAANHISYQLQASTASGGKTDALCPETQTRTPNLKATASGRNGTLGPEFDSSPPDLAQQISYKLQSAISGGAGALGLETDDGTGTESGSRGASETGESSGESAGAHEEGGEGEGSRQTPLGRAGNPLAASKVYTPHDFLSLWPLCLSLSLSLCVCVCVCVSLSRSLPMCVCVCRPQTNNNPGECGRVRIHTI